MLPVPAARDSWLLTIDAERLLELRHLPRKFGI